MVANNIYSIYSGTAATNQTFTFSGEMNITSCPITYYGHKYDKVYVSTVFKLMFYLPFVITIKGEKHEDLGNWYLG